MYLYIYIYYLSIGILLDSWSFASSRKSRVLIGFGVPFQDISLQTERLWLRGGSLTATRKDVRCTAQSVWMSCSTLTTLLHRLSDDAYRSWIFSLNVMKHDWNTTAGMDPMDPRDRKKILEVSHRLAAGPQHIDHRHEHQLFHRHGGCQHHSGAGMACSVIALETSQTSSC